MDIFDWITHTLRPHPLSSGEFIYQHMDSQSGRSLPIIYQAFDAANRAHWADRGAAFDYAFTTGGGRLLDFGPGDGWPSLIVAPFVDEVVGVDASPRRVEVCAENAQRLGIANARFIHVQAGAPLPFEDAGFDGVMAASSVEQTPDPKATLRELARVLRPGGRLRIQYEALNRYRDGRAREAHLWSFEDDTCQLILYNRDIAGERVRQYGLVFDRPAGEIRQALGGLETFDTVSVEGLERLRGALTDARVCDLYHPSGRTLVQWLGEIGFRDVRPTHSGRQFAARLFDALPPDRRPTDRAGVDALLRAPVEAAVQMAAPIDTDPMLTAPMPSLRLH